MSNQKALREAALQFLEVFGRDHSQGELHEALDNLAVQAGVKDPGDDAA